MSAHAHIAAARYARLAAMSDALRRLIDEAGGLHTQSDLARRWKVSRARVSEMAAAPTFPRPVLEIGRTRFYAGKECDEWRATLRRAGRPPKQREDT